MSKRLKNFIWLLLLVLLSVLTLRVVVNSAGDFSFADIRLLLRGIQTPWLLLAIVCSYGYIYFEALGLRYSCRFLGSPIGSGNALLYSSTDFYFSAITPTAAGGQPAALIIMMNKGVPAAVAAMALLENIIMYTVSLVIIGGVFLLLDPEFFLSFDVFSRICIVFGFVVQLVLIWFYSLCMRKDRLVLKVCDWGLSFLCRIRLLKNYEEKHESLVKTISQYRDCGKLLRGEWRIHVNVLLCNLAQRLSVILVPVCLFMGLGGGANRLLDAVAAQTMAILGSNAMPLPGAVGISDYLFLKGFGSLVDSPVSLDILSRSISFYLPLILCGTAVFIEILMGNVKAKNAQERLLTHAYGENGKLLRRFLTNPVLSLAAGKFMDTRLSRPIIRKFVRSNHIDLADYLPEDYRCFNDFFVRRIRPELRPVDMDKDTLISPCDGMLSAYRLSEGCEFAVKESFYTVEELLCDRALAKKYRDGVCLILRLGVDNYHRYCYFDNGFQGENHRIKGRYNPVMPLVSLNHPVYRQNTREYCLLSTESFGDVVQIEVGACLVGRIINHRGAGTVRRGEEKGMFQYGGSTIILLFEKDVLDIPEEFFDKASRFEEIPIQYGAKIAARKK